MKPPVLDRAMVDHLAELAALSLSDREAESMARELHAILAYVEEISNVDTSAAMTSETARTLEGQEVRWREDVTTPGLPREEALRGAPHATELGFSVPGFVGAGSGNAVGGGR